MNREKLDWITGDGRRTPGGPTGPISPQPPPEKKPVKPKFVAVISGTGTAIGYGDTEDEARAKAREDYKYIDEEDIEVIASPPQQPDNASE